MFVHSGLKLKYEICGRLHVNPLILAGIDMRLDQRLYMVHGLALM